MKKVITILLCVALMLSIAGCGGKTEAHYCERCGNETSDVKESDNECYYCYDCIINNEYEKCLGCGVYYEVYGPDCNNTYCRNCFDAKEEICFLCWDSVGEMVSLEIDGEQYFICPDCATDYFANIEPMIPVDFCIECGHLYPLRDYYYEHYIYDGAAICQKCLIECRYEKCNRCDRYTKEGLIDDICGYCIEKEDDKNNSF